ncbi:site-specific integrase [Niabella sp. CC-SYL272]|uniref:site-specific integrase n=1 Tax=Niabella agricola TaxID=2891571 RepID=UPI001F47914A|nr:site-specific integrase [Niabella agricola]MCF3107536.1 site-specific integrase [Niabella agricola]
MALPIKLICRKNQVHADGTCSIFVQYCCNENQKPLFGTDVKIPPIYWDNGSRCISDRLPATHGDYNELNNELKRLKKIVEDIVTYAGLKKIPIEARAEFTKKHFSPTFDFDDIEAKEKEAADQQETEKKNKLSVYYQFDEFIKSKKRKVSNATLTVYGNVKSHLLAFEAFRDQEISFDSFDFSFYEDFVDYLTFEHVHMRRKTLLTGLKLNTIGKTIKHLRGFIKDRIKRKIIKPIDLSDFRIPEEESDAIYLTYEEIAKIYQTDLSEHLYLREYRDLFVLACLTGLRFSDFSTLRPEDLQRDMLYKKQEKSDHWVIIPLRHEAKLIFTRQFRDRIPELTNPEFNRHIKTIGKLAGITQIVKFSYKKGNQTITVTKPKYEWITSHTARRSFCTNEFLAGTPVELIMKISGHKRTKDFYRYIRITPEEAARKVKELWLARNDMKLIKETVAEIELQYN